MTQPFDVLYASRQYQDWLADLKARAMLATHNQAQAMFRAVLHGLRRTMTTDQTLNFADALPPLRRGIFLEGWRPSSAQASPKADDVLRDVVQDLSAHHAPPDTIVTDVIAVLAAHLEMPDAARACAQLPPPLRDLCPDPSAASR